MAKTSQPTRAPNKALYLTDYARSSWDIGALSATLPALARAPRGDGHAVLVIPGLGASDMSTLIPRRFLSTLGYATYGWELGRNIGPTARVVSGLPERLHEFRARHDGPVSVIGWSLGGILARQLGRRHPDVIRQVITLASPILLKDHAHSNARRAYELLEKRHTETIQLPLEVGLGPLPVPATSVYTRLDGIVAWRACLDQPSRLAENVEVYASHLGIGNHPAALWVIADRLTQAPGKSAPLRPPARWRCAYPTPIATDPVDSLWLSSPANWPTPGRYLRANENSPTYRGTRWLGSPEFPRATGSSACAGADVPGGRQARTVLSASDRAWRSAAPGPSSSHSRSRAALRTRAIPLRTRPTSWRHWPESSPSAASSRPCSNASR